MRLPLAELFLILAGNSIPTQPASFMLNQTDSITVRSANRDWARKKSCSERRQHQRIANLVSMASLSSLLKIRIHACIHFHLLTEFQFVFSRQLVKCPSAGTAGI